MKRVVRYSFSYLSKFWRDHRFAAIVIFLVLVIVLAVQFWYPIDKVLPFAKLDNSPVGGKTRTAIAQLLVDDYNNVPVTLVISGPAKQTTITTTSSEMGVSADVEKTTAHLQAYPWWQRILPFSIFAVGALRNSTVSVQLDEQTFEHYATTFTKQCSVTPKNAAVVVKNGAAVLDSAKSGQQCSTPTFKKAIMKVHLSRKATTIKVAAETVKPVRSDKDVAGLLKKAETLIERKITLNLLGKDYAVDKATIASWLIFTTDSKDTKKLIVDVAIDNVRNYVAEMQKKIYIDPGTTTIYTTDSIETSRRGGGEGRGLDHTATADALKAQLLKGNGTVEATVISLPSKVVYRRSYTATQAGLQALLNDLVADKGDYGISVRMLDGTLTSARGTTKYHPASTYKLFVAYSLLKRIAAGEIKWEDDATAGKNVSQCFDAMIINSDNTCAEWFGGTIGWTTITNEVRALGLTNTNMGLGEKSSTADDETLFLMKLQNGTLLGQTERDRLLDVMKRQVYRSGIPAGTGLTVADKVGFLDGLLHDSAIVYAPNRTYTLTIMTNGSSWAQIADAAKQINALITQM